MDNDESIIHCAIVAALFAGPGGIACAGRPHVPDRFAILSNDTILSIKVAAYTAT
jgi:hypothetical protein